MFRSGMLDCVFNPALESQRSGWSTQQYSNEGGKEKRERTCSVSASMLIEAEIDLLPVSPGKGQKGSLLSPAPSPGLANLPSFWPAFLIDVHI